MSIWLRIGLKMPKRYRKKSNHKQQFKKLLWYFQPDILNMSVTYNIGQYNGFSENRYTINP